MVWNMVFGFIRSEEEHDMERQNKISMLRIVTELFFCFGIIKLWAAGGWFMHIIGALFIAYCVNDIAKHVYFLVQNVRDSLKK